MLKQKIISDDDPVQVVPESDIPIIPERRNKPRIKCDYPAIVEINDQQGHAYRENAQLVNLSACGLYLWTLRKIELGSKVSVTVYFTTELDNIDTPKLKIKGIVNRIKPQTDGTYGIAIKFITYRFI